MPIVTESEIAAVVKQTLRDEAWPVWTTMGDIGLTEAEYFEFARSVIRKLIEGKN